MDRRKISKYEMMKRAVAFGATHTDLFPPDTLAGEAFEALGRGLSALSDQAAFQVSNKTGARASSKGRLAARKTLRQWLDRMSRTADGIRLDVPGIQGKFRVPSSRRDFDLVSAGLAFARDAEPLKEHFVRHQMPPDFIDGLNSAVANLERSMLEQAAGNEKRANTSQEVDRLMQQCLALLQRVDAVVLNTLEDKPATMAEWETTRRIRKPAVRISESQSDAEPESSPKAAQAGQGG